MSRRSVTGVNASLTRNSLEVLLDLVEIKLGCFEVYDREDARELKTLQAARDELASLLGRPIAPIIAAAPESDRRRGLARH